MPRKESSPDSNHVLGAELTGGSRGIRSKNGGGNKGALNNSAVLLRRRLSRRACSRHATQTNISTGISSSRASFRNSAKYSAGKSSNARSIIFKNSVWSIGHQSGLGRVTYGRGNLPNIVLQLSGWTSKNDRRRSPAQPFYIAGGFADLRAGAPWPFSCLDFHTCIPFSLTPCPFV